MPMATSVLSTAAVPRRPWRPLRNCPISRSWPTPYSTMQTSPAQAIQYAARSHAGCKKRTATAANSTAVPLQPMSPTIRFSIVLSPPPLAVHRLDGEEQAERDETEVVDQMFGVDHALGEVVEVRRNRQVAQDAADGSGGEIRHPVHD